MTPALRIALTSLMLFAAARADALCIYKGVDNARTTIRQEYADAQWVVRVRVISATDSEDTGGPWTVYRLQVLRAYKGRPSQRITFFTMRDSGGFYMDRPWEPLPAGHDIGGEYLLFLNPIPPHPGLPAAARGAAFVNYSCGQSQVWEAVSVASRRLLTALSQD